MRLSLSAVAIVRRLSGKMHLAARLGLVLLASVFALVALSACGHKVEPPSTPIAKPSGEQASEPVSAAAEAPYWKGVMFSGPPIDNTTRLNILNDAGVSWWFSGNYETLFLQDPRFVPMIWGITNGQYVGGTCTAPSCLADLARIYRGRTWLLLDEPERPDQANLTPAAAANHVNTIASAIRAADSTAKLFCCGTWADDMGTAWMREFAQSVTARLDGVHVHSYSPGYAEGRVAALETYYAEMQKLDRTRGLPIWITEVGFHCREGSSEWVRDSLAVPFFDWYRCGTASTRFPRVAWYTTSRSTGGWTPTNLYEDSNWARRPLGYYYRLLGDIPSGPPAPESTGGDYLAFDSTADTYLSAWSSTQNYGLDAQLVLRSPDVKSALLHFDVSSIPRESNILRARLVLHVTSEGTSQVNVSLHRLLRQWAETEANWGQAAQLNLWGQAGANSTLSDRLAAAEATLQLVPGAERWYVADLSALARLWVNDPDANRGLIMRATGGGTGEFAFASADNPDTCLRPHLEVWYESGAPLPSPTPSTTSTPTVPTATATASPSPTATLSASGTPAPTQTGALPPPSATATGAPLATETRPPTPTWTLAPEPTATPSPLPTATPTIVLGTATPAMSPTWTLSAIETRISGVEQSAPALATRLAEINRILAQFGPVQWPAQTPMPSRQLTAYRVETPPAIDSDLSDWKEGGAVLLNRAVADYVLGAPLASDPQAEIRARWTKQFVYLAIRVWDARVVIDSGPNYWQDDGIEIGLDGDRDRIYGADHDHTFSFRPDGALFDLDRSAPLVQRAVNVEPGVGYTMEIGVPISMLKTEPVVDGTRMGISLGLRDDDSGDTLDAYLVWGGSDPYFGQQAFAELAFSELPPQAAPADTRAASRAIWGSVELQQGKNGYLGTEDTYLIADECGGINFSGEKNLGIGANPARRPLLRFELSSSLPERANVTQAILSLRAYSGGWSPMLLDVYQVLRPWKTKQASWQEATYGRPWTLSGGDGAGTDRAVSPAASAVISLLNMWYDMDITSLVQGWVANPTSNWGVMLVAVPGPAARYEFYASESPYTGWRPRLTIYYQVP